MCGDRWVCLRPKEIDHEPASQPFHHGGHACDHALELVISPRLVTQRPAPARSAQQSRRRRFSGLLTRVEIGHTRITSTGKSHQLTRIGFVAKPARIVGWRQNKRHTVMDVGNQLIGIRGDDREGPNPFARCRLLPVLQMPASPNGAPSFMAMA
jgi:hypothetical protein